MNATVKSADTINHGRLITWRLPSFPGIAISEMKRLLIVAGFIIAVFASSMAVVYVQNINRQLIGQQQQLLVKQHQLLNQRNELLQQKGILTSQTKIDTMAQQKFNMRLPNARDVVMVQS